MNIIGISGKMATGKDTLGLYLNEKVRSNRTAFAKELKNTVRRLFNVDPYEKTPYVRMLLQRVGVAMREIDPDVWVNFVMREAEHDLANGADAMIVTDLRFPNELEAVKNAGGITVKVFVEHGIRMQRLRTLYPGTAEDDSKLNHISETALDDALFDFYVETNTHNDMKANARLVLAELEKRGVPIVSELPKVHHGFHVPSL